MKKIPNYNLIPALLLIYLAGMSIYFGGEMIRNGETLRFIIIVAVELAIIFLLRFLLKKKAANEAAK